MSKMVWTNSFTNVQVIVEILGDQEMQEFLMDEVNQIMDANKGDGWYRNE